MAGVNVVPLPVHIPPTAKVDGDVVLVITPLEKATFPATVRLPPVKFNVLVAPPNVRLLQLPVMPVDRVGQFGAEVGITTVVVEVGIEPPHQLVPTFQSVLVVPNHVPTMQPVFTLIMPVFAATNHVSSLWVAEEPKLPQEPVT